MSGPFSFVGSTSGGFAIGVVDGKCAIEMALTTQVDEDTSRGQKFYLGSGGSIHSTKCPGLVIAMDTIDCIGGQLTLQTTTGEARSKWTFNSDGLISSVSCPDFVIGIGGGVGSTLMLTPNIGGDSQIWRKVNTRLLSADEAGWNQDWNVDFVEKYHGSLPSHIIFYVDTTCYLPNPAYSASFEDFAWDLIIEDASTEDLCRTTRELLGYDRDYPFDTVRDKFNDFMCDGIVFTAADHYAEGLSAPPEFTEVEFEAPE